MKNPILVIVFLCSAFTFQLPAQSIVGNWKMTVPTEEGGELTIQVSMTAEGTYTVDFGVDGTAEVNGKYKLDGNKITIKDVGGPQACPQEAVYQVEVSDNSLKMTRVKDPCEGRGGPEGVMVFTRS